MTNLKLSSKKHLLIIISSILIVIGLAVGTICQFVAGGFFNYGSEFSDYKCVTVSFITAEQKKENVQKVCDEALKDVVAYEVSFAETTIGGELVYKFNTNTSSDKLNSAVAQIKSSLNSNDGLSSVELLEATTSVGGAKVVARAAIVIASAIAVQFIYFALRYKFTMALSAIVSNLHNVGLTVALVALTRIPVGIELVAIASLVVLATIIASTVYYGTTKKDLKDEANAKADPVEVCDNAAIKAMKINLIIVCTLAVAVVLLAIAALIASPSLVTLAPYAVACIAVLVFGYGCMIFTPATYPIYLQCAQAIKNSAKNKTDK